MFFCCAKDSKSSNNNNIVVILAHQVAIGLTIVLAGRLFDNFRVSGCVFAIVLREDKKVGLGGQLFSERFGVK